jgi:hypothetical protein
MRSEDDISTGDDEMRQLLVGTWTGIALIAEILIGRGVAQREQLVSLLSEAEALAKDRRRIALSALRKLLDESFVKREFYTFGCTRRRS